MSIVRKAMAELVVRHNKDVHESAPSCFTKVLILSFDETDHPVHLMSANEIASLLMSHLTEIRFWTRRDKPLVQDLPLSPAVVSANAAEVFVPCLFHRIARYCSLESAAKSCRRFTFIINSDSAGGCLVTGRAFGDYIIVHKQIANGSATHGRCRTRTSSDQFDRGPVAHQQVAQRFVHIGRDGPP